MKSLEKDKLWSCSQCTYKNPLKMADCQMCGSSKSHRKHFDPNLITLQRQPSSLMADIRKIEEDEALELWQHITLFCGQVGQRSEVTGILLYRYSMTLDLHWTLFKIYRMVKIRNIFIDTRFLLKINTILKLLKTAPHSIC